MNILRILPALLLSLPLYAQRTTIPLVIRPTAKGEVPIANSTVVMSAMCDDAGNAYGRLFDQETGWGGFGRLRVTQVQHIYWTFRGRRSSSEGANCTQL